MNWIASLLQPVLNIIDKAVPDVTKATEIKAELVKAAMDKDSELQKVAASIIVAEAQGESWLQRNWRPLTMLTFVFIIFNNYILAPYTQLFFDVSVVLETPPDLWDLIKIGLGGYVVGRSAEKVAKNWKGNM